MTAWPPGMPPHRAARSEDDHIYFNINGLPADIVKESSEERSVQCMAMLFDMIQASVSQRVRPSLARPPFNMSLLRD